MLHDVELRLQAARDANAIVVASPQQQSRPVQQESVSFAINISSNNNNVEQSQKKRKTSTASTATLAVNTNDDDEQLNQAQKKQKNPTTLKSANAFETNNYYTRFLSSSVNQQKSATTATSTVAAGKKSATKSPSSPSSSNPRVITYGRMDVEGAGAVTRGSGPAERRKQHTTLFPIGYVAENVSHGVRFRCSIVYERGKRLCRCEALNDDGTVRAKHDSISSSDCVTRTLQDALHHYKSRPSRSGPGFFGLTDKQTKRKILELPGAQEKLDESKRAFNNNSSGKSTSKKHNNINDNNDVDDDEDDDIYVRTNQFRFFAFD